LVRFRAAKARREKEEGEHMLSRVPNPSTIASSGNGPPPPDELGEDLIVSGNQMKRASGERWGKKKQEVLLAELGASGNMRRACKAAGISKQAVGKRRDKEPYLDAACKAAMEASRARAHEYLARARAETVGPDALADPH